MSWHRICTLDGASAGLCSFRTWHAHINHKNGSIPSHRAPQKLWTAPFDSKLKSLSFGLVKSRSHHILPSKHKNGRIPSNRVSQKLSTAPFDSKFNSLSFGLAKSRFYENPDYSAPNLDYTAPSRDYSAPNLDYSAPDLDYSTPNLDYSAPGL